MTKQEQIDEMAKYICNACEMGHGFDGCSYGGREHYKRCSITQKTAKALYDAGYRKVPDGAVVLPREDLTKEPYNEFCKGCPNVRTRSSGITDCCADYNCRQFTRYANLIENYEQVRKETAKEILLLLGKGYDETEKTEFNNLQWYKEFCRELKHRYGVEVEE